MTGARRLAIAALAAGMAGVSAGSLSWSVLSSASDSAGNTFSTGTVGIGSDDEGGALLSLSGALPGATSTGCIEIDYDGTLAAAVKLYATGTGGLGSYLTLTVTRGTNPDPAFPSCTNFKADSRDYIGQGAGVIYSGNLSSYPASYETGLADPSDETGLPESWTSPESHSYKLEVTLQNNLAAEGQSASPSFVWEARSQ